jgi:hypothetical protein
MLPLTGDLVSAYAEAALPFEFLRRVWYQVTSIRDTTDRGTGVTSGY